MRQLFFSFMISVSFISLTGCGIQSLPQSKNAVDAALAEVQNQYKRRSDLVPNLVEVVKGYASHEKETLTSVIEARAKATQTHLSLNSASAKEVEQFQLAQGSLTQALSRLMVVVEKYPNLKADQNFRDLSAQLEGTENRITVARNRYIEAIQNFNNEVTVPPTSWTNSLIYHYEKLPQWDVSKEEKEKIQKVPEVKF